MSGPTCHHAPPSHAIPQAGARLPGSPSRTLLTTLLSACLAVLPLPAVLAGAADPADPAPASINAVASAQLQRLLEARVASGSPGMSAAVVSDGRVVWTGTAGTADLATGTPVTTDMLFGIGSITKVFVAVVVLQLAEEQRLRVDDTAADILGPAAVQGIANADTATLAQLLAHTSGIPSWEDDPMWIRAGRGDQLDPARIWGKQDPLAYIRGHAALAPPGERYSYSNTNFTLLGMIIEAVTGRSAVTEIHERILAPLGLKDIHLEGFEPVPPARLPHRYHWATEAFRRDAGVNAAFPEVRPGLVDASGSNLSVEWTAGGMVATPSDIARFAAALRDGRLLKPESLAFMQAWQPATEGSQIGHSLFRTEFADDAAPPVIGHTGGVLGFGAWLFWIEGQDIVLAVTENVGTMHVGKVSPAPGTRLVGRQEFIRTASQLID